jgi:hypothetical protein
MKRITLFVVALFCVSAFADDLPRIAVYVTGNVGDDEKKALGTRMLASLVNSGRYKGIERSNSFLAEIEKEQVKQMSGDIDDSQISALGKQFGVKFVCIADITPAFSAFQVSARIVNVETAEVEFIGDASSPLETMDDLEQVSVKVVEKMFGEETMAKPEPIPQEKSDVQEKKKKKWISAGVGWSFSEREDGGYGVELIVGKDDWGDLTEHRSYHNDWEINSIHAFLDVTYAEIGINLAFGNGHGDFDHRKLGDLTTENSFTGLGVSVLGKYPIGIVHYTLGDKPLGFYVFPAIGVEYAMLLSGKSKHTTYGGSYHDNNWNGEYEWDGKDGNPKAGDYNALWFKGGGGVDLVVWDIFIRAEILFGIRPPSKTVSDAVKYHENRPDVIDAYLTGLSLNIDAKLCIGYKF